MKTPWNLGMNLLHDTQCQFPGCDIVWQLPKMLPLGETDGISLYYFLLLWTYLHVNLQLFQNKRSKKDTVSLYEENHITLSKDIKELQIRVTHQVHGDEIQY